MSGESLDRYFRMIRDDRHRRPSGRLWCPAADVYRSKDGWIVMVDGDLLRISGSRRDATCGEGISHYQLEITYSRFEKMIRFPRSIEQASIDQDYRDGLLILQLREVTEQARAARG